MTAVRRVVFAAFVVGLGLSITLSESALAVLTALWLWRLRDPAVRRGQAWPLAIPVLAFTAATLLSAVASGAAGTSVSFSKGLLLMTALYVTADHLAGATEAERFLTVLSAVVVVAAVIGLLQVSLCPVSYAATGTPAWLYHKCHRARGTFSIYMTLAGVLMLTLLATLPRLLPGFRPQRWFAPVWLLTLAGLVATFTRGAWIGFGAGVLALLPGSRHGRIALVAGLVVLTLAFLAGPAAVRQRFLSMSDPEEATVKERRYMWESGIAMWRAHPWLGLGPGGVKREYARFALPEARKQRTGHVHNTPLQILVERGVLGLAAWIWIWAAFYVEAVRAIRRLPPDDVGARRLVLGSAAAITGFLVNGLSEYNFGDSEVALVAWTLVALPWVVGRPRAVSAPGAV